MKNVLLSQNELNARYTLNLCKEMSIKYLSKIYIPVIMIKRLLMEKHTLENMREIFLNVINALVKHIVFNVLKILQLWKTIIENVKIYDWQKLL